MNSGTFLFLIASLIVMVLPMMPAFSEWLKPSDAEPLRIVQEFDSNTSHFAQSFKQYIEKNFSGFFVDAPSEADNLIDKRGTLKDGTQFIYIRNSNRPLLNLEETLNKSANNLILAANNLLLPDDISYMKEIYGARSITGGKNIHIRAALAEGDINLGENTIIIRWIHAGGSLFTDTNCTLYGRASADNSIILKSPCKFERVRAPFIQFGEIAENSSTNSPSPKSPQNLQFDNLPLTDLRTIDKLQNVKEHDGRRWLISENFKLPPNSFFDGDIIAAGDMEIGYGSSINGSIKSNGNLYIDPKVTLSGSAVSAGDMVIGSSCAIHGPVICEGKLLIGNNTVIGTKTMQTNVTASTIHCHNGVQVYGTIWAYHHGLLLGSSEVSA